MATGTGKTITALAASIRLLKEQKRLVLVIACPFQHLVDQWVDEAKRFGFLPIRAYKSKHDWLNKFNQKVIAFNHQDLNCFCVITTHSSFSTNHFLETINRINGPILLVADEVHHLGADKQKNYLSKIRLISSCTLCYTRIVGMTMKVQIYYVNILVKPFLVQLSEAIQQGFLTPYYYYPTLVELTAEEMVEYNELSAKIGPLIAQKDKSEAAQSMLERLLIKSRYLNAAENKIDAISQLVDQQKNITHTLFYCAPGGQIDKVVQLLGWEKRLKVHRFTANEDTDTRQQLLEQFDNEQLQALVAMRCLDEGVDVPSTRTAYILASSSNPREFIQRRGRILRNAPGKETASIYDLNCDSSIGEYLLRDSYKSEKSLIKRELQRFAEFADSCINTQVAYEVIWDLAKKYHLLGF